MPHGVKYQTLKYKCVQLWHKHKYYIQGWARDVNSRDRDVSPWDRDVCCDDRDETETLIHPRQDRDVAQFETSARRHQTLYRRLCQYWQFSKKLQFYSEQWNIHFRIAFASIEQSGNGDRAASLGCLVKWYEKYINFMQDENFELFFMLVSHWRTIKRSLPMDM